MLRLLVRSGEGNDRRDHPAEIEASPGDEAEGSAGRRGREAGEDADGGFSPVSKRIRVRVRVWEGGGEGEERGDGSHGGDGEE